MSGSRARRYDTKGSCGGGDEDAWEKRIDGDTPAAVFGQRHVNRLHLSSHSVENKRQKQGQV